MMFQDRIQAGARLAQELIPLALDSPIVLALPRGGVPVGQAVAKALACAFDVIPFMKIPIPWSPEASYGVVAVDGTLVLNRPLVNRLELSERELEMASDKMRKEAERRDRLYRRGLPFPSLAGRTAVLVDDGLASGYSMLAAIHFALKRMPRSLVVASPVASDPALRLLAAEKGIDRVVTLARDVEPVFSLGDYYREFNSLGDDDVLGLLSKTG